MIDNQLTELALEHFPNLQHVEARGNQIERLGKLDTPNLKALYLAKNNLISLEFLEEKPALERLHLRENKIASLNGLHAGLLALSYINLRENALGDFSEIDKLAVLPSLRKVTLIGNPLQQDPRYRLQIVMRVPQLEILDKVAITAEDREAANALREQLEQERIEREKMEAERLEQERIERERFEQEEALKRQQLEQENAGASEAPATNEEAAEDDAPAAQEAPAEES